MVAWLGRRQVAALFAFLGVAVVGGSAWAQASPPPPSCQTGQYADQFGNCVDACQTTYTGGIEFISGEQKAARYCFSGEGITVSAGGDTTTPTNRPYCWHYVGTLKDSGFNPDGRRYEDYSLYTNPRDICNSVGAKECSKLGCDLVEGGANPLGQYVSASGKPAPVIAGTITKLVNTINSGPGQYVVPGGTAVPTGVASEYCAIYGYNYNGTLCQLDPSTYTMKPIAGVDLQQANDTDPAYTPSTTDVNCVIDKTTVSGSTLWYAKSGICNGTFWATFDPAAQISACKSFKGSDYAGPQPEGYNPAAASPTTVCLLSNVSPYWKPKIGAAATGSGSQPYSTMPDFYACEYSLARSAGANAYQPTVQSATSFVYRATGNACGTVGAVNSSGSPTGSGAGIGAVTYKPGPNDQFCDNGQIQNGWDFPGSPAKCSGEYISAGGVESANHYFGGQGGGFVRVDNGGQISVVTTGDGTTPEPGGYSVNSTLLGGDPSKGTTSGAGSGSGSPNGTVSLAATADMPSTSFDPWYTPKYPDGPKGVWLARIAAVKTSKLATWVDGFKVSSGSSYVPHLQFDLLQYHVDWTMPAEIIMALRALVLVSAALSARKIIFGG